MLTVLECDILGFFFLNGLSKISLSSVAGGLLLLLLPLLAVPARS
jgi:hypothetical protein